MANNDDRKDVKRQKIQSEQRAAYAEDMALIQSAFREAEPSTTAADDETEKNKNSGDGHQEQQEEQEQQQQQQQVGQESDDDEEGAGNWLKTFTPHHTRVGSEFQVTELPTPQANTSREPAVIAPKQ
jgi:hypothetical protein